MKSSRRQMLRAAVAPALAAAATTAATATGAAGSGTALPTVPVNPEHPRGFIHAADGTPLFYRDHGVGPPVVFLSSWGLSSQMWDYQVPFLTGHGLRCIAFDRRSHGRSGDPGRGYDFDTLAYDVRAVVASLGLDGITLVAHSFGAGEAVRYLAKHAGGRVQRLILLAPCTPFLAKAADNPSGVDGRLFDQIRAAMAADFAKWVYDGEEAFVVPATSHGIRDWLKAMMLQSSLPALLALNRAMTETDLRTDVREVRVPTLIIHGDKDASLPLPITGKPTAELIPGAQLKVIAGAPHGLFVTHARQVSEELLAFIKKA
jgi:non-heme chloroperoxidase